ncbi:hypothetical protein TUM15759_20570 [Neisseria gonorrhoeae]|nr:hypothetical protein TUM15759_20570 [Neisseria gonorrhoeae]
MSSGLLGRCGPTWGWEASEMGKALQSKKSIFLSLAERSNEPLKSQAALGS